MATTVSAPASPATAAVRIIERGERRVIDALSVIKADIYQLLHSGTSTGFATSNFDLPRSARKVTFEDERPFGSKGAQTPDANGREPSHDEEGDDNQALEDSLVEDPAWQLEVLTLARSKLVQQMRGFIADDRTLDPDAVDAVETLQSDVVAIGRAIEGLKAEVERSGIGIFEETTRSPPVEGLNRNPPFSRDNSNNNVHDQMVEQEEEGLAPHHLLRSVLKTLDLNTSTEDIAATAAAVSVPVSAASSAIVVAEPLDAALVPLKADVLATDVGIIVSKGGNNNSKMRSPVGSAARKGPSTSASATKKAEQRQAKPLANAYDSTKALVSVDAEEEEEEEEVPMGLVPRTAKNAASKTSAGITATARTAVATEPQQQPQQPSQQTVTAVAQASSVAAQAHAMPFSSPVPARALSALFDKEARADSELTSPPPTKRVAPPKTPASDTAASKASAATPAVAPAKTPSSRTPVSVLAPSTPASTTAGATAAAGTPLTAERTRSLIATAVKMTSAAASSALFPPSPSATPAKASPAAKNGSSSNSPAPTSSSLSPSSALRQQKALELLERAGCSDVIGILDMLSVPMNAAEAGTDATGASASNQHPPSTIPAASVVAAAAPPGSAVKTPAASQRKPPVSARKTANSATASKKRLSSGAGIAVSAVSEKRQEAEAAAASLDKVAAIIETAIESSEALNRSLNASINTSRAHADSDIINAAAAPPQLNASVIPTHSDGEGDGELPLSPLSDGVDNSACAPTAAATTPGHHLSRAAANKSAPATAASSAVAAKRSATPAALDAAGRLMERLAKSSTKAAASSSSSLSLSEGSTGALIAALASGSSAPSTSISKSKPSSSSAEADALGNDIDLSAAMDGDVDIIKPTSSSDDGNDDVNLSTSFSVSTDSSGRSNNGHDDDGNASAPGAVDSPFRDPIIEGEDGNDAAGFVPLSQEAKAALPAPAAAAVAAAPAMVPASKPLAAVSIAASNPNISAVSAASSVQSFSTTIAAVTNNLQKRFEEAAVKSPEDNAQKPMESLAASAVRALTPPSAPSAIASPEAAVVEEAAVTPSGAAAATVPSAARNSATRSLPRSAGMIKRAVPLARRLFANGAAATGSGAGAVSPPPAPPMAMPAITTATATVSLPSISHSLWSSPAPSASSSANSAAKRAQQQAAAARLSATKTADKKSASASVASTTPSSAQRSASASSSSSAVSRVLAAARSSLLNYDKASGKSPAAVAPAPVPAVGALPAGSATPPRSSKAPDAAAEDKGWGSPINMVSSPSEDDIDEATRQQGALERRDLRYGPSVTTLAAEPAPVVAPLVQPTRIPTPASTTMSARKHKSLLLRNAALSGPSAMEPVAAVEPPRRVSRALTFDEGEDENAAASTSSPQQQLGSPTSAPIAGVADVSSPSSPLSPLSMALAAIAAAATSEAGNGLYNPSRYVTSTPPSAPSSSGAASRERKPLFSSPGKPLFSSPGKPPVVAPSPQRAAVLAAATKQAAKSSARVAKRIQASMTKAAGSPPQATAAPMGLGSPIPTYSAALGALMAASPPQAPSPVVPSIAMPERQRGGGLYLPPIVNGSPAEAATTIAGVGGGAGTVVHVDADALRRPSPSPTRRLKPLNSSPRVNLRSSPGSPPLANPTGSSGAPSTASSAQQGIASAQKRRRAVVGAASLVSIQLFSPPQVAPVSPPSAAGASPSSR